MNPVIFREYDIRGVYDVDFDNNFATQLGRAYVSYLFKNNIHAPTVTLGHDARLSSPYIVKSLAKGIVESGGNVIHLGLITTPLSYFSTFHLKNVCGSIMVTGSHNPPNYNGFKISVGKQTIYGSSIQSIKKIILENDFLKGKGSETHYNIFPEYIKKYQKDFNQLKNLKVVLDCGNGAAGCVARDLYRAVGLDPIILFENPDGQFPNHHPDPTVSENIKDLIKSVKEHQADIGIGFDGDCDRIGVVDSNGNILPCDEMMAIIARSILEKSPGSKIIGDVKCSDRLFDDIKKHGGVPIMWKTGHSLIKEKIKLEKAPFGGELSGHIFFSDRNYGFDDALYAGLRLIEIMLATHKSIPELLTGLPKSFNTPEIRIDTTEEKKNMIVKILIEKYQKPSERYQVNLIDGIRISFVDGWALVRASNTQPVLVMRFESSTKEGLNSIKTEVESIVKSFL